MKLIPMTPDRKKPLGCGKGAKGFAKKCKLSPATILKLHRSGKGQDEIAALAGVSPTRISQILKGTRGYVSRSRNYLWTAAPSRKAEAKRLYESGVGATEIANRLRTNLGNLRRILLEQGVGIRKQVGRWNPAWKGGRRLDNGRYWLIYNPNHPHCRKSGVVLEHRIVAEKTLGRYLSPSEVVHHIDGNGLNNSPENLQVFQSNAQHLAHELKGKCPKWTPEGKLKLRKLWSSRLGKKLGATASSRKKSRRSGLSLPSGRLETSKAVQPLKP